ncbi:hypothetical protein V490_02005 [Pseudogymnoascus sp. VKM F-3557]|nr:hypothetical protein V490_02005 [Pseudogymnoascus sp. VKM F-3557]
MSNLKVLIIGASIAGPTTAYWLAKSGADITIIERFPSLRTNGQNVDIRTSGVTIMRKMPGMEAAVRTKMSQMKGINFVLEDGTTYASIKQTGNPEQQSLVSEYEIFRGDLSRILFDLTQGIDNIKYVFGEQVVSMRQQLDKKVDGPITVEFANGLPTAEYDLVVACDGATSRTRAMGIGCGAGDYIRPSNCWAAFFSIDEDLFEGSHMGHAYSAIGGRFIAAGSDDSGVTRVVLMGLSSPDNHSASISFREAMKKGDDGLKQFVARNYEGAGWKTEEIIKGMINSKDFYANEIVQVKPPSLYNGHFVLVGDAGYAAGFTGAGTTLAITGAYLLAGEIIKHKGNIDAGLSGYEAAMGPMITKLQKEPPLIRAILAPQTVWGVWIRNKIFSFVAWSRILEFAQKYFASAFSSADKFGLPEYEWAL